MKRIVSITLALALLLACLPNGSLAATQTRLETRMGITYMLCAIDDLAEFDADQYQEFVYKALARNPENFEDEKYVLSGYVLQVLGNRTDGFEMRLATDGKYGDVVYLMTYNDPGFNVLDDDQITVYGRFCDMYTYKTTSGGSVTLPMFIISRLELDE